jgi:hypothetical protein
MKSKTLALLLGAAGLVLLALTARINWDFGHSLVVDQHDAFIQASAGLAIDIFGAILALVAGVLWCGGHRLASTAASVLLVASFLHSSVSLIGWSASGRMGKAETEQAAAQARSDAARMQMDITKQRQEGVLDWMKGSYVKADKGEKRLLIESATELASKPVEVPVPAIARIVVGDRQARVVAGWTGWSVEQAQVALVTYLAILMKLCEISAFWFTSLVWPRRMSHLPAQGAAGGHTPTQASLQIEETLRLSKSTPTHPSRELVANSPQRQQAELLLAFDRDAARRDYYSFQEEARSGVAATYWAKRWNVHRTTSAKWVREWRAEDELVASSREARNGVRVLEGGRA